MPGLRELAPGCLSPAGRTEMQVYWRTPPPVSGLFLFPFGRHEANLGYVCQRGHDSCSFSLAPQALHVPAPRLQPCPCRHAGKLSQPRASTPSGGSGPTSSGNIGPGSCSEFREETLLQHQCVCLRLFPLCSGFGGRGPSRGACADTRTPSDSRKTHCGALRSPVAASPGRGLGAQAGESAGWGAAAPTAALDSLCCRSCHVAHEDVPVLGDARTHFIKSHPQASLSDGPRLPG